MKVYTDPLTGDTLTRSEHFSWLLQSVIRRWTLLLAITLLSAAVFTYTAVKVGVGLGAGAVSLLTWWNLWASWMALMIEGTVGIAMFSAGRRDQVILRRIRELEEARAHAEVQRDRILRHLEALLDHHGIEA